MRNDETSSIDSYVQFPPIPRAFRPVLGSSARTFANDLQSSAVNDQMDRSTVLSRFRGDVERLKSAEVVTCTHTRRLHAIRVGSYKYILDRRTGAEELYNVEQDPDEQRNLIAQDLGTADALRARLRSIVDESVGELPNGDVVTSDDPRMMELLRSLGYVE